MAFHIGVDYRPRGDQATAIDQLFRGLAGRRKTSGSARRHRLRQDLHHGEGDREDRPPGAGSGPQQDAGRAALSRVQDLLPWQRRRILRQLLRLLSAGSLHALRRHLHRKRSHHQRRTRQAAPFGHPLAVRAPRLRDRRQRQLHLRPRLARSLLRHAADARKGPEDLAPADSLAPGGNSVRAQRQQLHARHISRARRRDRGVPHLRRLRLSHRAVGRRRSTVSARSIRCSARSGRPICACPFIPRRTTS